MSDLASPSAIPAPPRVFPPLEPASRAATVVGVLASLAVVVVAVAAWWPHTEVVNVFRPDVPSADGQQHVAVVRDIHAPITALRLSDDSERSDTDYYEVVFGTDPSGNYGHRLRLDIDTSADLDTIFVHWDGPDGATIEYPGGHQVHVPGAYLTGGR